MQNLTRRFFNAVLITACSAVLYAADPPKKPVLTGDWKMIPQKSDFGRMPVPANLVRKVTHTERDIALVSTIQTKEGRQVVTEWKYKVDGDTVNKVGNTEIRSNAKWDGAILEINSKRPGPGGAEISSKERWTVAEDGKTMMVHTTIISPNDELRTMMILEKQ